MTSEAIAGRRLGEFVVVEKLGEGGFGEVYRAHQPSLARDAVVKISRARSSDAIAQRFLREAQLAAQIDHPYAAHVYAFGAEPDGLLWIAMEHLRGTPLSRLVAVHGALSLDRFVPLFERLCDVVHAVHERGIVHRDIKPSNVMIIARGGRLLPKLIDLGIAGYVEPDAIDDRSTLPRDGNGSNGDSAGDRLTSAGQVFGSPAYMAPEQWRDPMHVDRRADIYALGLVAYECLAGRPAYSTTDRSELQRLHREASPPALPSGSPSNLSRELERALAKRPSERHASAIELGAAVRAASGLAPAVVEVPHLPRAIVEHVLANAPRPIADATALVAGAGSLRELRAALELATRTIVRYVGVVAVAARAGLASSAGTLETARPLLDQLPRRRLSDDEWYRLAAALCHPLSGVRDAFPLPELMDFITGVRPGRDALAMLTAGPPHGMIDDETERRQLVQAVRDLAEVLDALTILDGYVLAAGDTALMGVSKGNAPAVDEATRFRLLGPDRDAVVDFGPLLRLAAPMPGGTPELFVFDGRGRRGAALRSARGYELADDEVWSWLARLWSVEAVEQAAPSEASPYPGLVAFTVADAPRFFGRDAELATFRNRLRASSLLAVVGSSGAGKSSFALAGVAADLASEWHALVVRPGGDPVAALVTAVARLETGASVGDLEAEAIDDPAAFSRRLHAYATVEQRGSMSGRDGRGVLVVVDQLEELFTACGDPRRRDAFARVLDAAARRAADPVRVVVTLRDDFIARTQELPSLHERIGAGLFLLSTPSRDDLIRIVSEPARRAGYEFDDPELPVRMVDEVAGRATALPLLAFAAARMWELRDPSFHLLRAGAYAAIGGVTGALVQHAEATLVAMTVGDQRRTRGLFHRLVSAEGTRAGVSRAEAIAIAGGDAPAERIVESLVASRLLSLRDTDTGEQLEIVHEALITEWPRLAGWFADDRAGARLRAQIREAARGWDERSRPTGLLWSGDALADLERALRAGAGRLTAVEDAFVSACRRATNRTRRARRLAIGLAFGALATAVVILFQLRHVAESERERSEAIAADSHRQLVDQLEARGRAAVLDGRMGQAVEPLVRAYDEGLRGDGLSIMLHRVVKSRAAELRSLQVGSPVRWAELGSDGARAVTLADGDGRVTVWDVATGRPVAHERVTAEAWEVRLDAGGARVAIAGSTPKVWNVDDGTTIPLRRDREVVVQHIAFGPAQTLVTTTLEAAEIWDAGSGSLVRKLELQAPSTSRLAIAGPLIAVTDGNMITLWDAAGNRRGGLVGHTDEIVALAASADGRHLATGSADGTARLWNLAAMTPVATLHHGDRVDGVALDPAGAHVLTTSVRGGAKLWDRSGAMVAAFGQRRGVLTVAAIDTTGGRALIAGSDGVACIHAIPAGALLQCLEGHRAGIKAAVFGPDGSVLTASFDGTARRWRTEGRQFAASLQHPLRVASVAMARELIATCDFNGTVRVWERGAERPRWSAAPEPPPTDRRFRAGAATPAPPVDYCAALDADADSVLVVRPTGALLLDAHTGKQLVSVSSKGGFSAGKLLRDSIALATNDGVVELRSRAGALTRSVPAHRGEVMQLASSRDGTRFASAGSDGEVAIFDARLGTLVQRLVGHLGPVSDVEFGPGDVLIGTAGHDHTVRIWDAAAGRTRHVLRSVGGVRFPRFTRDGSRVLTGHEDGTVQVWSVTTGKLVVSLREHSANVYSLELAPDRDFAVSGSRDGSTIVWDLQRLGGVLRLEATHDLIIATGFWGSQIVTGSWDQTVRLWTFEIGDLDAAVAAARSSR